MSQIDHAVLEFRIFAGYMWPGGVEWGREMHRDIVRTFMAGYLVALQSIEDVDGVDETEQEFVEFVEAISQPEWWPLELRFRWKAPQ